MLKKVKTATNDVVYINEDMVSYIKKMDPSVTDKESNWEVHLNDEEESIFTLTYDQMKK
ncbi:hypothetical protein LOSG293_310140 [Secundilactobacillus oryzae JCM 18671]|uniref:Uncharacterized protein n=1 Tax=Secundilactobacillus oryzae JCM 18671 TaxID=1291743 RepID=A0A081BK95_9LACO|nr:hypothetical protein [Secundilactobacillus oryzae]GAK48463.1 hypothetical protein LOSG293_310140 [Secundilactobacillus oryzae JCM 18671]